MPKNTNIRKVLMIGSGPIVIGQAAEFDYAGAQACRVLKDEGIEVVDINGVFRQETCGDEEKLVQLIPDGLHPNNEGQKIIFRELCKKLECFPQFSESVKE